MKRRLTTFAASLSGATVFAAAAGSLGAFDTSAAKSPQDHAGSCFADRFNKARAAIENKYQSALPDQSAIRTMSDEEWQKSFVQTLEATDRMQDEIYVARIAALAACRQP